jgi:hypothetical protein
MKIPEDQTDPTLIEKAKSLFGVTFTDHAGTEHTAFDYLHGHVFYVRDKCPAPEYNGTVSCCKVESYLTFYEEYLNLIRVKKENNQDQFIIDNGIVAMFDKRIVSNTNCPSVNFHALYNTWPPTPSYPPTMNTSNKWKLELLMAKIKKTDLESLTDQQIKEFFERKDINTLSPSPITEYLDSVELKGLGIFRLQNLLMRICTDRFLSRVSE